MKKRLNAGSARKYILLIGDIVILIFSLWLTLLVRYQENFNRQVWDKHFGVFSIVLIILLIIFYIDELYEMTINKNRFDLIGRLFRSMLIGSAIAFTFFYLGYNRFFTIKPQRVFLIYIVISWLLIYIWRISFYQLAKSPKIANGLIIVGFNALAEEIINELNNKPEIGFRVRAIIPENDNQKLLIPSGFKELIAGSNFENLKNICLESHADTIISTIHPRQNTDLLKNLFKCLSLKINFFDITDFYEKITGKIPVNTIEQIWFFENMTGNNKKFYDASKRIIDIMSSLILLILTLPFTPLIAIIIKLTNPGPIFFIQQRTGIGGKNFMAIKFRSMVKDAEINGPQWATKNDARVTSFGKILRKSRIDEIPQLINVLRGEMSLIGPRPERPEFIEQLQQQIPFYKERLLIKPGLTGWAQVVGPNYGGSVEESLEKLQYDLFYVKNRSIGLDINIILKTIKTVLTVKGQ